ncbi:MAG: biotin/lipoyl-binding protein, partial [Verrucomicrobiaceae bacterium]
TVYAHTDGVIGEVLVVVGDTVEAGDLLVRVRQ